MARAIRYLAVIAALIAGAVWLADNGGMATLNWQGWRVDTPVAVLVVAGLAFLFLAGAIHRFWLFVARAPGAVRESRRLKRRQRGYEALTRGMVAIAAGDADEAGRQARRAESLLNDPPLTLLLQAQSAQLAGDEKAAANFFLEMARRPETEFLGVRGLLVQAMKRNDRPAALDFARRAWRLKPKSAWVAGALFDLEVKEGRWLDAQATLDAAQRAGALPKDEGRGRRAQLLAELAGAELARGPEGAEAAAHFGAEAHKLAPDSVPAALVRGAALLALGENRKAAGVVERTFGLSPHPELAVLYARARGAAGALEAARAIRKLVAVLPDHAESRMALARALTDAKLWGEARAALDGFGDNPPARACRLMAEIEDAEKNDAAAVRHWLLRAASAEPDPAWVCSTCGAADANWHAACSQCGTFGGVSWRQPPRAPMPEVAPPSASAASAFAVRTTQ